MTFCLRALLMPVGKTCTPSHCAFAKSSDSKLRTQISPLCNPIVSVLDAVSFVDTNRRQHALFQLLLQSELPTLHDCNVSDARMTAGVMSQWAHSGRNHE